MVQSACLSGAKGINSLHAGTSSQTFVARGIVLRPILTPEQRLNYVLLPCSTA